MIQGIVGSRKEQPKLNLHMTLSYLYYPSSPSSLLINNLLSARQLFRLHVPILPWKLARILNIDCTVPRQGVITRSHEPRGPSSESSVVSDHGRTELSVRVGAIRSELEKLELQGEAKKDHITYGASPSISQWFMQEKQYFVIAAFLLSSRRPY